MSQGQITLFGLDVNTWAAIGSFATVIYTVLTLLILLFVAFQLRAMQKQLEQSKEQLKQSTDTNEKIFRQNTWNQLFSTANHINDYIANRKDFLGTLLFPEKNSSQDMFVLLFHHVNLAYLYYVNKGFFTEQEWKGIERWIDKVFFPWIASSNDLFSDFKTVLENDSQPKGFIDWLTLRPAMEECERKFMIKTE